MKRKPIAILAMLLIAATLSASQVEECSRERIVLQDRGYTRQNPSSLKGRTVWLNCIKSSPIDFKVMPDVTLTHEKYGNELRIDVQYSIISKGDEDVGAYEIMLIGLDPFGKIIHVRRKMEIDDIWSYSSASGHLSYNLSSYDDLDTITDFAVLISRVRTLDGKVYKADMEELRKDLSSIFSTDECNIGI